MHGFRWLAFHRYLEDKKRHIVDPNLEPMVRSLHSETADWRKMLST